MNTLYPAKFIKINFGRETESVERYGNACSYFRREFALPDKKVVKAELMATAIGVFKAYINGLEADGDYMSPGFTDYRKRIPWCRYDITDKLQKNNAVVLVAGDGWAVGYMGNSMYRRNYYRDVYVCAKIVVYYEDGSRDEIITDENWRADTDEIVRTDNYMGEVINHTYSKNKTFYLSDYDYKEGNWRTPECVMCGIFYSCLSEEIAPRIKVMHVLTPEVIEKNERFIRYDFKQNMVGVLRVKVKGERGTIIVARHAEMLENDGTLYTENLRKAEATDTFILSGEGEEEFRPLFTFHGFRYAELRITGKAEILSVTGEVMYSALDKTGEFTCSDEIVNRVYKNVVWGQRGNFLSVPTDCPQRDERLGWTGDAQIFCGTAMFNMDCEKFYKKYILDLIDSSRGDGTIGGVAPHVPHTVYDDEECHMPDCAGWADAMAVIPYEYYLMYGNKQDLRDHMYFVKNYIKTCEAWSDDCIRPSEPNWGDWLNVDCFTDKSLLSTAYFAFSTRLTIKMCEICSDPEKLYFENLYNRIKTAFRKKFLMKNGTLTCHTQTAYLLSYASGIMSKEEIRAPFLDTMHKAGDKLTTGFLGIKFLLPTLCDLGETDLAYKVLCSREYPGWGYSAVNGATTMWERWNSYTKEKGFGDAGMNSFNHYSFGSVAEWMFKYCLGIRPDIDGAGFIKLTLCPAPDVSGKLTHAEGSYDSKKGKISVSWKTEEGKIKYFARVPKEIDLTLDMPENVVAEIERY